MKIKPHLIASAILIGALIFLSVSWWINGRDDTWLYAVCVITVLTSFIPIFSQKDKNDQ